MADVITIQFKYTEKEYLSAVRMYFARTLNPGRDLVIAPLIVAVGLFWWFTAGYDWLLMGLIVVGILVVAASIFLLVITPRLHWSMQPKLREEYTLTFSDEGIGLTTEHIDSKVAWGMYKRIFEDERFFILVYGRDLFTVIPKRGFSGSDEEAAFGELARRNIQGTRPTR